MVLHAAAAGVVIGAVWELCRVRLASRRRGRERVAEREAVERAIRAQGRRQTTWEVFRPNMLCFYRSTVQDSGWGLLGAADAVEVNGVVVMGHGETEGERDGDR